MKNPFLLPCGSLILAIWRQEVVLILHSIVRGLDPEGCLQLHSQNTELVFSIITVGKDCWQIGQAQPIFDSTLPFVSRTEY